MRRWWIFALAPVGAFVGWLTGRSDVPDWMVALVVTVMTVVVIAVLEWRSRRLRKQFIETLAQMPEYLTERMWARAEATGLISPKVFVELRRKQAAERARQRQEEHDGDA